jgi:hypothetical protein
MFKAATSYVILLSLKRRSCKANTRINFLILPKEGVRAGLIFFVSVVVSRQCCGSRSDFQKRPDPNPDPDLDPDPNKFTANFFLKFFLMKICSQSIFMD